MLYGYARVSTDKQENSVGAQQGLIAEFARRRDLSLSRIFVDEDVTGSMPLNRRPAGRELWDIVGAGDFVVFSKLDRGFRNMSDAANTLRVWQEIGVTMEIMDLPTTLTTPEGRLIFHQFAAFSQFERERIGQRVRDAMTYLRTAGRPYASARPWGWVRQGKEYVPCEYERETGALAMALRAQGNSYRSIALALYDAGRRKPVKRKKATDWYHLPCVRSLCRAAQAGYPKIRQDIWQAGDYAQTLSAEISGAHPLSS